MKYLGHGIGRVTAHWLHKGISKPRMKGRIYISGAFTTVVKSKCNPLGWLDNDPHFWESPPTWGICRPDIRETLAAGDYIFFVLPLTSDLPQMIYGYMRIAEIISHEEAYRRNELKKKRMGNKNPNGNIIVNEHSKYNRYDGGFHKRNFTRIKRHYAIGDKTDSEFLSADKIKRLAPDFLATIERVLNIKGSRSIDIISRWGRRLSPDQISQLLKWLKQ